MMDFQASDFLAGLYASMGPAPELPTEGNASNAVNSVANEGVTTAAINTVVTTPHTGVLTTPTEGIDALGFDFDAWTLKPDVTGRLGLEAPNLPEAHRWWAEDDFDQLPIGDWACPQCGGLLWWEDLLGVKHCLRCEPDKAKRADRLAAKAARLRRRDPPTT